MINENFELTKQVKQKTKINKKHTIFTRGCFDCLHLGHFVLLTTMLVESSKILSCSPYEINFLLSLADQETEKFKNTNFINTEDERRNNLIYSGIVDEVIIHGSSHKVLSDNISRIKCFCIGFDQDEICIFQKMVKTCEENNIITLKLSSRLPNISSTLIRKEINEKSISYIEAKRNIESQIILDRKSRDNILLLKELGIISNRHLEFFNLDSEAKTLAMKKLDKVYIKDFFVEKYNHSTKEKYELAINQ